MVAVLAIAAHMSARDLLILLHTEPDVFDSIWYTVFPVKQATIETNSPDSDQAELDRLLRGF